MCKSELYDFILTTVEEGTEVTAERILSPERTAEVVEARCLFFFFLWRAGFSPTLIAEKSGHTRQSISKHIESFDDRLMLGGKMFARFAQRIGRRLAMEGLISGEW